MSCYQSQNYKIWKQFTTLTASDALILRLLSITKLQNLKAIHNRLEIQLFHKQVVINHKTTKFESNSQQKEPAMKNDISCYQSQNYKIWKQFTTSIMYSSSFSLLLSITKLQNLKAIHNTPFRRALGSFVVINHKTTKFESNSQRNFAPNITN